MKVLRYKDKRQEISKNVLKNTPNCMLCGNIAKHTHHIDHCKDNNHVTNLAALCVKCHYKYHGIIARMNNKGKQRCL